jgi:hypothetical protein
LFRFGWILVFSLHNNFKNYINSKIFSFIFSSLYSQIYIDFFVIIFSSRYCFWLFEKYRFLYQLVFLYAISLIGWLFRGFWKVIFWILFSFLPILSTSQLIQNKDFDSILMNLTYLFINFNWLFSNILRFTCLLHSFVLIIMLKNIFVFFLDQFKMNFIKI